MIPYRHEPEDPKENHDKTSQIIQLVMKFSWSLSWRHNEMSGSDSGVAASGT